MTTNKPSAMAGYCLRCKLPRINRQMKNETYKNWQLFDDMPSGWTIDKTCGSPLTGYLFITNGRSVLRGGKRALLRVREPQQQKITD